MKTSFPANATRLSGDLLAIVAECFVDVVQGNDLLTKGLRATLPRGNSASYDLPFQAMEDPAETFGVPV